MPTLRPNAISALYHNACARNPDNNDADLRDIMFILPANYNRPPPAFRGVFNGNAADPSGAKGPDSYDNFDLWDQVMQNQGAVSPDEARAFVDGCLRGRFANEKRITDPRAQQGLRALDFETIVTLYEKIAEEDDPATTILLRELNKALGLDSAFYEKLAEPVVNFFAPANTAALELQWREAQAAGRIKHSPQGFAATMGELLTNPPLLKREDYLRRIETLQFICDSYSEFVGESTVKVGLFNGQPGLKGVHVGKEGPQGELIGINATEMHDFRAALNILMHERQHASQDRLAEALSCGRIKKGDDNYRAARVFAANRGNNGYMMPQMPAGPQGYLFQPMEIDAHNAGNIAEYEAGRTYGRQPKPHMSAFLRAA